MANGRAYYPYWPNTSAKPAISVSSESAFAECPRKWFNEYNNYLLPMVEGQQIRAERPLISGPMLTGRVAHDVIDMAIRQYKETGESPKDQLEDVREVCRKRFRDYHTFSRQWADATRRGRPLPQVPGLSPMEAVFRGISVTPEEGKRLLDSTEACVHNFLRSPVYSRIMAQQNPDHLIPQPTEPLQDGWKRATPWYWADDNPIYASYDLIILTPSKEGELSAAVIDWKTGSREKGEGKVERQLNYYAPFVVAEYGVPYERIELAAAWIGDCAEISSFEPSPTFVELRSARWSAWRQDLRMRTACHAPLATEPYSAV